jgi:hypothetical protein
LLQNFRWGIWGRSGGGSTWTPSIDLGGNLAISFRPDPAFSNGLNAPGLFSGVILNRENIGKSSDELVELWNTVHPEDPVHQMQAGF